MGYSTEFSGEIKISPALSAEEINFLMQFNRTRHTQLKPSPYAVGKFEPPNLRDAGRDIQMKDSYPPEGQPGLWCNWIPTNDGTAIKWSGAEKSYNMSEWLEYLIVHFIGHEPLARSEMPFLTGHSLNGEVEAAGARLKDLWKIVVEDSVMTVLQGKVVYEK